MQMTEQQRTELRDQIRTTIEAAQAARADAQAQARASGLAAPQAPGAPVILQQPDAYIEHGIPPQAVDISIAFFVMTAVCIVGFPLARAFGRRIERRGVQTTAEIPPQVTAQLARIEQAVEAMSIEVERINEGQRYVTKVLAERERVKELPGL